LSRPRLEELDAAGLEARSGELLVVLTWLVLPGIELDEDDRRAAVRRALLVLAAGGDPHRELDHDSVAVARLAEELDAPELRSSLATALAELAADADGLATVTESLAVLQREPELAWRTFALALLADELTDD
jgi:hypothetical protein